MQLNTQKIRSELKRLGKTQSAMARELGYTRQMIWYILAAKRRPHFATVEKIARYFKMDPKDLIK